MRKIISLLIVLFPLFLGYSGTTKIISSGKVLYISGEIIFKLKPAVKSSAIIPYIVKLFNSVSDIKVRGLFPSALKSASNLENIYSILYVDNIDPLSLSAKLAKINGIEWAEPRYVYETTEIPNDPLLGNQWGLTKIKAQNAWDVTEGDTSVVIGIVDTGVDWDHPDLTANIWHNRNEIPNNGIDDDGNGYIDDVIGWDFGGLVGVPDNDPMEDANDHGTHVAGIAAAVTNNGTGVASVGYKCRIMPVKTTQNNNRSTTTGKPYVIYGYEGITYAVNNGCKVINCSWGGYGYSLLGRDVSAYAAGHGALIVAAAGNDNSPNSHYPASYPGVLSVAASSENDVKASFSNYGANIDVTAPGDGIYSTWSHDTYIYSSGTSMASPMAAGLAAIVRARFPQLNALQAGERVRVTCDDISAMNTGYSRLLGRGRVNALNAVSQTAVYSVRAYDVQFYEAVGNNNGILEPGETGGVRIKFRNMLNQINSITIGLENTSSYCSVQNGTFITPALAPLDSFSNYQSPFTFTLSSSVPQNTELSFVINYVNGSSIDFQWISVVVNPSFAAQSTGDIQLTVTSKGTIAYNDYPSNLQGLGFRYQNSNSLLFEGALILGTSASKISDAARGNTDNGNVQNADFQTSLPFQIKTPGSFADMEGSAIFNDNNAGTSKLGVTCSLKTYSFSSETDKDFVILRYALKNTGSAAVQPLYAGLFTDWDLIDGNDDYTAYDTIGKLGYAYHLSAADKYTGVAALESGIATGYFGILNAGGDGGIKIYDGFSDAEKWQCISTGISKPQAGGGDISFVLSGGPLTLQAGETKDISFAIIAGGSINELRASAQQARLRYNQILVSTQPDLPARAASFDVAQNYPNPFNPSTVIDYTVPEEGRVKIAVFNSLGSTVAVLYDNVRPAGKYSVSWVPEGLASGIYFCRVTAAANSKTLKMIYLK